MNTFEGDISNETKIVLPLFEHSSDIIDMDVVGTVVVLYGAVVVLAQLILLGMYVSHSVTISKVLRQFSDILILIIFYIK